MKPSLAKIGIHVVSIGGSNPVISDEGFFIDSWTQVKQDAFVDKGDDGFQATVKRYLTLLGGGEFPKDFLLVITERLENAFLPFSGGVISRALDGPLEDYSEASYDETGSGYKERETDYIPVLVCVLGRSESFQRYAWQGDKCPAGYQEHPVQVLNRKHAEQLFNYLESIHAGKFNS